VIYNAVPDKERVLAVVNADGYQTGIEGVKLFCVLRELAQLASAVRSPVAAIENQENPLATHRREANGFAVLVLKCKIWCRLPLGGSDLWLGQNLLWNCKN
jgi:hypothetical protein